MKKLIALLIIFSLQTATADVSAEQKPEVEHLLEFLRQSDCVMVRNGTEHNVEDATSHIQKKYDYFKGDITSTEEFIEYSATKSTMSGKYYTIRCTEKEEIRTQDWLQEELEKFRNKK
ncbi:MAG: DUF5329 family protein [Arenicellales bacterium]